MTTTKTKRRKSAESVERVDPNEVVTAKVLEALRGGTTPWRKQWACDPGQLPTNATTLKSYSGINLMVLLMFGGYGSPYWLTFRQARAAGGAVRKGERGLPGVRWVEWMRKLTPEEVAERRAKGLEIQADKNGNPVAETIGARGFTLFNVLQCDGLDLDAIPVPEPVTWAPTERAEAIITAATEGGGPQLIEGGDSAQYRPASDVVYVPDRGRFENAAAFYHAVFHELAHATGHESRLARPDLADQDKQAYGREELVAELAAAMLCAHAGLPVPAENSAAYIEGWIATIDGDHRLMITAAQRAKKAVDYILNSKNERRTPQQQ